MKNESSECECRSCLLTKRIRNISEKLPIELRDEILKIYDELFGHWEENSTELGCLHAKLAGDWPRQNDEKYYERIDGKLYEIYGVLVKENICNHDPYESLNNKGECDSCCDHVFDFDGAGCNKCGKTVSELLCK